ncbi:flavodoxin family protein [candidate division KSB3 bacterium]|uniref:Flavodoxin family protein n=1 Tax=candidate division KSB3 bacterium TaxID=2044937 RepID=A0A9D5JXG7_9BACT|nr:flavodoxin family protein [candidate division KSB3 bacterium]MBD3326109.1 flavodoxin family protein [candidate division KSB3 bacterium]
MKVVAFNGSARKDGNTARLLQTVLHELDQEGITTEMVQLAGKPLRGCTACRTCFTNKNRRCVIDDDIANACIAKMIAADGILLGSPVYFSDITSEMKALIDRAGLVGRANDNLYRRKVGAAVAAVRRAGAIHTLDSMQHFFFISQMIVPGSSYWNLGIGREIGEVEQDDEGVQTMRTLGQNMAWLLKKLHA